MPVEIVKNVLLNPRSSLELGILLVRHLAGRPKALISALRSEDRQVLADTPPYWKSVIDWMLQLIRLI